MRASRCKHFCILAKTQNPSNHSESQVAAAVYMEHLWVNSPEGLWTAIKSAPINVEFLLYTRKVYDRSEQAVLLFNHDYLEKWCHCMHSELTQPMEKIQLQSRRLSTFSAAAFILRQNYFTDHRHLLGTFYVHYLSLLLTFNYLFLYY